MELFNFLYQLWPWYVVGPLIALIMFGLLYSGKTFGVSNNLRTMCSAAGGGYCADFFQFNWKNQSWNLVFVFGGALGGFIAYYFLTPNPQIELAAGTTESLKALGMSQPGEAFVPPELFGEESLFSLKTLAILVGGGLLVGFGARYAGGCTSGHAITGLSDLQLPSLIAVIGFFLGGLAMTWLFLPQIIG